MKHVVARVPVSVRVCELCGSYFVGSERTIGSDRVSLVNYAAKATVGIITGSRVHAHAQLTTMFVILSPTVYRPSTQTRVQYTTYACAVYPLRSHAAAVRSLAVCPTASPFAVRRSPLNGSTICHDLPLCGGGVFAFVWEMHDTVA